MQSQSPYRTIVARYCRVYSFWVIILSLRTIVVLNFNILKNKNFMFYKSSFRFMYFSFSKFSNMLIEYGKCTFCICCSFHYLPLFFGANIGNRTRILWLEARNNKPLYYIRLCEIYVKKFLLRCVWRLISKAYDKRHRWFTTNTPNGCNGSCHFRFNMFMSAFVH